MPAGLDLWSGALFGCQAPKHAGLGNAASNPPALLWDVLCSLKPGKDLAWTFAGVHMWLLWLPCWSAMICSTSSELRFALAKGSYSRQSPTFWGRCTSDCCSFRNAWMQRFLECHVNIVIYPLCTVQICATHRSPKGLTSTVKCSMNVAAQITNPFGMSIQFYRFLPKPPLQYWLLTAHSTRHTLILWPFKMSICF